MKRALIAVGMILGLFFADKVQATLYDRGFGLIYDDVLNITWLQNANYAAADLNAGRVASIIAQVGSVAGHTLVPGDFTTDGSGHMTWFGAMAWAETLVYIGFRDWRLALMDVNGDGAIVDCLTVTELSCRDNEYGYMYYQNLNGVNGGSELGNQTGDGGVTLNNIQSVYWSGTATNSTHAGVFFFNFGGQGEEFNEDRTDASWAVRVGDVLRVPEPATWLLVVLGLAGLAVWGRRKSNVTTAPKNDALHRRPTSEAFFVSTLQHRGQRRGTCL